MKIVLVTGTRETLDLSIQIEIGEIIRSEDSDLIIYGDCPTGVDFCVKRWANDNGIPVIPMPARWNYYERSRVLNRKQAGPDRNYDMCKMASMLKMYGHEVICLAFPKGDDWSGTRDCMAKAERWNIPVKEYVIVL